MVDSHSRIVVAEAEAAVAKPLVAHLEGSGFDVRWVTTVRETRETVEADTPDVLVLASTLDTDGLEYLQSIRFAAHHPRAGVVVISDDVVARERGLQLGAVSALAKPLDGDTLQRTLEQLLAFI